MPSRLHLDSARALLDFAAGARGVVSEAVANDQLEGAVALHNLLQTQGVAYLADEVGMGKTYVALGAMALLRHFQPNLRVMVIAPKENIQRKWIKEWRNFVGKVVQVEDLRVKAVGGHPVRALVKADSLAELATETSNDPDRDFFARLTSFSLPISSSDGSLEKRRRQLLKVLPWLDPELLSARNKERYKRNFARALNCALPEIDLLIVDEAHNLKAGWRDGSSAIRNTVVGCALGGRRIDDEFHGHFRGYGPRAKRVLFLSATPIETDIRQLWNQLDLFGFGAQWKELRDQSLSIDEQRSIVRRLLIRRTAVLHSGPKRLTKTEYRREWRGGGITAHDEPLRLAGDRQRLAVALVQKKVSELLGSGRHNHSFQVGLLASFESFLETAQNARQHDGVPDADREDEGADDAAFHRSADEIAAQRQHRRDGFDIAAINSISKDYLRTFEKELPHPKMDAIVDELARSFTTGRKALVFVRRVASVDELQRKLEEKYDELLFARLRRKLETESLRSEMEEQIAAYSALRREKRHDIRARNATRKGVQDQQETSTVDSFFAWFFRGEGPEKVRSGASLAEQMDKASGAYSTLLEDNHVAALLGVPVTEVVPAFARALGVTAEEATERLATTAAQFLGPAKKRTVRRTYMHVFQAAALLLLERTPGELGEHAKIVRRDAFPNLIPDSRNDGLIEGGEGWLRTATLFTELRQRSELRKRIWPERDISDFEHAFRERERRREFLATMIRKGHPIVDMFILIANRLGTLKQRSRELAEDALPDLGAEFLDLLDRQRTEEVGAFTSFYELSECAAHFDLIVQLNVPDLQEAELAKVPALVGKTMRAQRPVAGMAGTVNGELVRQFRMPGYPLILITTDLLKEGEDLHTFCSSVYHYGIAWMPSELEQRVGRIDRVGSQTERRLNESRGTPDGSDLLQVYYPHLSDTVEVLQLNRVYERLNRFLRMMHEGLGSPPRDKAQVSVIEEGLRSSLDVEAIREPLKSAFSVQPAMLSGAKRPLAATVKAATSMRRRFEAIRELLPGLGVSDVREQSGHQIVGEMRLTDRVQPFTLLLRSLHGRAIVRCVSPVGRIDAADWDDRWAASLVVEPFVRISLERNERFEAYDVAVEGDVLLSTAALDRTRVTALLEAVIRTADRIEHELLKADAKLRDVNTEIDAEASVER